MSELKTFICAAIPDEKSIEESGARKVARALDAKDERHARAKCSLSFVEDYPGAQDAAYKFLICELAPGIPCPASERWDEGFMYEHDWSEDIGHPVIKAEAKEPIDIDTLSTDTKIAALVLYGHDELTMDLIPAARELLQEETPTFEGHIVEAINKTSEISSMHSERILNAIGWVMAKCAPTDKWPEIKAELVNWKKRLEGERKPGGPSKSIAGIVRDKAASIESDKNPANDTDERPKRTYKHTYQTLDQELANAFWPGDVNPGSVDGEIYRWAKKEVIEKDRDDWKRFSAALRTIKSALEYDLLTIRDLVQMRPDDIHKDAVHLSDYINAFLLSHGVFEDETKQDTPHTDSTLDSSASTAGTVAPEQHDDGPATRTLETAPPVERTGPFYYRTADGQPGRANKLAKLDIVIAQGCIEITKEEYQALKEAPPVQQPTSRDQPGINNLGNGRFSIEGLAPDQPQTDEKNASNEVEKTENVDNEASSSFTSRAEALTKELNEKTGDAATNLSIWKRVHKTDPARTKAKITYGSKNDADGNREILRVTTSINPTYQEQRATELFGPFGIGWGVDIEDERFDPGIPFMEPVYDANGKFLGKAPIRNADGSIITSVNHTIRINLWYLHDGVRGNIPAYGHTKYIYQTKSGAACDDEFAKKSLTDATTKALSKLGFSADVYTGLFDDADYSEQNKMEHGIKGATARAEDIARIRKELDERMANIATEIEKAATPADAKKIHDTLAREIEAHRKSSEDKGDMEYEKYLSGRLRRLNNIKEQRIKELTEQG